MSPLSYLQAPEAGVPRHAVRVRFQRQHAGNAQYSRHREERGASELYHCRCVANVVQPVTERQYVTQSKKSQALGGACANLAARRLRVLGDRKTLGTPLKP